MNKVSLLKMLVATSLLGCLTLLSSAQKPKPDPAKPPTETGSAAAATGKPVFVTRGYVRMHHPEFLLSMAQKVKSGGADQSVLVSLAGAQFAQRLLQSNTPPPAAGQKLNGHGARLLLPPGGFHLLGLTVLGTNEYSPQTIELDSMIPTEIEAESVDVTSPIAGTVTASVTNLPNDFNILMMESYTGYTQGGPNGSSQIVDKTSTNGTLPVLANQQFTVILQIGSFTEGTFKSTLNLSCAGSDGTSSWTASIPMTIKVSNTNKYGAVRTGAVVRPVAFPGQAFNIPMSFKPVNFRAPFTAKIHSLSLYGVTAQDTSVSFTSNSPVSVTLKCMCQPTADDHDISILATEITADDGQATDSTTTIDIVPPKIVWHCGAMSSGYHVWGYQPFGSIGSFNETWKDPEWMADAQGNYTLLGTMTDDQGGSWSATDSAPWAQYGIYFSDASGLKHGTYGQSNGQTNWIKNNWADIANGVFKSGAWFDPGGCAKWFDGNLPPRAKNGTFTLPGAWSKITVLPWAIPANT